MFIIIAIVVGAAVFTLYRIWRRKGPAPAAGMAGTPSVGLNGAGGTEKIAPAIARSRSGLSVALHQPETYEENLRCSK